MPRTAIRRTTEEGRVFPPRDPEDRKPGPKVMVGFRCPPELRDYLKSQKAGGYTETDAIVKMIELFRDASEEMGPLWWEVFRQAKEEGIPTGTLLGRLAAAGIERRPRKK